jgi:hypothetical protein
MKKIFKIFLALTSAFLISISSSFAKCPDKDVWIYLKCNNFDLKGMPCVLLVHVPKNSLECDKDNCPIKDTKVVGEARLGKDYSYHGGLYVGILKKGILNNPKNYITVKPNKLEIPQNIKTIKVNLTNALHRKK